MRMVLSNSKKPKPIRWFTAAALCFTALSKMPCLITVESFTISSWTLWFWVSAIATAPLSLLMQRCHHEMEQYAVMTKNMTPSFWKHYPKLKPDQTLSRSRALFSSKCCWIELDCIPAINASRVDSFVYLAAWTSLKLQSLLKTHNSGGRKCNILLIFCKLWHQANMLVFCSLLLKEHINKTWTGLNWKPP